MICSAFSWPGRASYFNWGVASIANDTGLVTGWMRQNPNQSIRFYVSHVMSTKNTIGSENFLTELNLKLKSIVPVSWRSRHVQSEQRWTDRLCLFQDDPDESNRSEDSLIALVPGRSRRDKPERGQALCIHMEESYRPSGGRKPGSWPRHHPQVSND